MSKEKQENIIRPKGAYPGIFSEASVLEEIVDYIIPSIVKNQILALRIANQPPYGLMFRVDNIELLNKVWLAKGRINGAGEPDLVKNKPVTSLSNFQLTKYIDWEKLNQYGYNNEFVRNILDVGIHTVLPVRDILPSHLNTESDYGPTLSVMSFDKNSTFNRIVEEVSVIDENAIIGGTSLNKTGNPAYIDTIKMIEDNGGRDSFIDMYVLSNLPDIEDNEQFHSMVSLNPDGIRILRKGIGYDQIIQLCLEKGLKYNL